jgi:hypothetical protein
VVSIRSELQKVIYGNLLSRQSRGCSNGWLCNEPARFMRVMNDVFRPYIDDFFIVYLDDVLIFSRIWEDHIMRFKTVFEFLKKEKLYVKMSKCEFGKTSLVYLGYIVGNGQLKIDPTKVEVIVNWPNPTIAT